MLNRTNRKLSAKTNGLNLGTRKLAGKAGANFGSLTLHPAARLDSVRVDTWDQVGGSVAAGSIMIRSYLPEPMPTMMQPTRIADSSSHPHISSYRGCRAGTSGQVASWATRIATSPVRSRAERRERRLVEAEPRRALALGSEPTRLVSRAFQRQLTPRQVPDATP